MATDDIIRRIEAALDSPGLTAKLADELSPTDLQSLLLAIYQRRSARRSASDVLADYVHNRFVAPSDSSPERLQQVEAALRAHLPKHTQMLELSPVAPLGTSAVLADVSQYWSVPTARNTEVVSDATNVLALECALARRTLLAQDPKSPELVHRGASHRLLRPQFHDDANKQTHFRLFHLCSAGRDQGRMQFESTTMFSHAATYLSALYQLAPANTQIEFRLTDFHAHDRSPYLATSLLKPLQSAFPTLLIKVDTARTSGRGYYRDLCFHINALPQSEAAIQLADGGSVGWTQKLLGNAKERLMISAISAERLSSLLVD